MSARWLAVLLFLALLPGNRITEFVGSRAGSTAGVLASWAWITCVTALFLVASPLSELIRMGPLGRREIGLGVGAGLLLFVVGGVGYVVTEQLLGMERPAEVAFVGSLGGAEMAATGLFLVAGTVAEELAFRGVVLEVLRRGPGTVIGVLASSLAFAAYHLSAHQLVSTALFGTGLAVLTVWAGGLWPAVVAHLTLNTLGAVLSMVMAGGG